MPQRSSIAAALAAAIALIAPSAAQPAARTLYGTVGPGFTITLKTKGGALVKTVPAGTYTIVVRDKSPDHNFRLAGPRLHRATSVEASGTTTWRNVRLAAGKTYRFICDPHADHMRGSFRVR